MLKNFNIWTSYITHWSFVLFLTPSAQSHTTHLIFSRPAWPVVCKKNNSNSWENGGTSVYSIGTPHVELWIKRICTFSLYFLTLGASISFCTWSLNVPKFFGVQTLRPGKVIKMDSRESSFLQKTWILCLWIFKSWIN